MKQFVVGITGATGSIYGVRLIEELLQREYRVFVTITKAGLEVMETELGISLLGKSGEGIEFALCQYITGQSELVEKINLQYLSVDEIGANIASGSFVTDGMAVVPCSMSTLSGIAQGRSQNLLERAADVMLKEGRPLLLSPREMPFNSIHLENMLKLSHLGVIIAPPIPGFYHHPETVDDLVDFVVGKILDRLRISHQLFQRWEGNK
jgi:4-hydroxy-3-polyprenylbenzoate decarboxylase